jgi:hypothetical protein
LAQQAILGRQPVQYQPLLTPETYQNFYGNQQQAVLSPVGQGGNLVVPDYRGNAQIFKQEAADREAIRASSNGGGDVTGSSGSASVLPSYGASGMVDANGNFAPGIGQGIDSPAAQNIAFGVLGATEGVGGLTPGGALANLAAGAYLDNQINNIDQSFGALGSANSLPGVVSVSDTNGNVGSFSTPGSVALSDANTFGGIGTNIGIGDTGSTVVGGGGVADTGTVNVDGVSVSSPATIAAQDAALGAWTNSTWSADELSPPRAPSGSSGSSGGTQGVDAAAPGFDIGVSDLGSNGDSGSSNGKIVCTAMNQTYGFGSFRNAIWLRYSSKHLTKAHEAGYHAIFLPLVDFGFKQGDGKANMVVRRFLEWGARHRSADLRAEMRGTRRDPAGRVFRLIFEPLCYAVGKLKGY